MVESLNLIINEMEPIDLLDLHSDDGRRVVRTFVNPISPQNKLRCKKFRHCYGVLVPPAIIKKTSENYGGFWGFSFRSLAN
ncbi:hypothetical protein BGW36DRAFT_368740 [Talaromyces proteolyticus]|uniref:Uncharacterized protein n=1 Tax=Talaromyces proteolyticus TaxID=1131652 RepID=A0AAD4KZM2_9EURO|nr:uncharacterized protein BGW36DRAFT_368740 [Talaromyces proteolyticus]KAH8703051.1 hypothetical protein BGW36DRAFT_368740 [Talaromyces proteolyticus]